MAGSTWSRCGCPVEPQGIKARYTRVWCPVWKVVGRKQMVASLEVLERVAEGRAGFVLWGGGCKQISRFRCHSAV